MEWRNARRTAMSRIRRLFPQGTITKFRTTVLPLPKADPWPSSPIGTIQLNLDGVLVSLRGVIVGSQYFLYRKDDGYPRVPLSSHIVSHGYTYCDCYNFMLKGHYEVEVKLQGFLDWTFTIITRDTTTQASYQWNQIIDAMQVRMHLGNTN